MGRSHHPSKNFHVENISFYCKKIYLVQRFRMKNEVLTLNLLVGVKKIILL